MQTRKQALRAAVENIDIAMRELYALIDNHDEQIDHEIDDLGTQIDKCTAAMMRAIRAMPKDEETT